MPGLKQSRLALMKRLILTGLASLAMISVAPGRTDPSYVNNLVLVFNPPNAPPMIDATNFVNNVAFIDNTFNRLSVAPFETANTVYYTNFGVLGSLQGFRFDTFNTDTGLYSRAGTLHNGGGRSLIVAAPTMVLTLLPMPLISSRLTGRCVWFRRPISSTGARLRWGRTGC